jgi:uncharacterized membrane protein
VRPNKAQILVRERAWGNKAGLASILGALLALVGFVMLRSALGGSANFEGLEEAHEKVGTVWASGVLSVVGFLLLVLPMVYLFRAVQARSDRVRSQLIGIVVLGPLLLGISAILLAGGTQEAANNYLNGNPKSTLTPKEANEECAGEEKEADKGQFAEEFEAAGGKTSMQVCEGQKHEEDKASNAIKDASTVSFAQFFGIAGGLAMVIALFYTCLWAMRVGLLTRFWGALGMVVGIATLVGIPPFMLLWFVFLGVLLVGKFPGGKPAAWDEGEAIPWQTPGQRMAESLEPKEAPDSDVIDVDATEVDDEPSNGGPRRKRKRRD